MRVNRMSRWGMVIDVKRCVTCYACVLACKQEHFLPPNVFRGKLYVGEKGTYPDAKKFTYPIQCNQCEEAVCVDVCPTGATNKREDGIVTVDADKCTGCQHCVTACPYQQRMVSYGEQKEYFSGQGLTPMEKIGEKLYPHPDGTIVKCEFCKERIDKGLKKGLKPGVDAEATPACVNICMCKARVFGDLDDPESEVSRLIKKYDAYTIQPEFKTRPAIYYID
jgi:phenylacetyl-CoA:acceptor oxidoreductase 27-kDa subunit